MGIIIVIDFVNEFKSSALLSVDIILKCYGLDWLVRSHRRVSVGASRDPILGRDSIYNQNFGKKLLIS